MCFRRLQQAGSCARRREVTHTRILHTETSRTHMYTTHTHRLRTHVHTHTPHYTGHTHTEGERKDGRKGLPIKLVEKKKKIIGFDMCCFPK